MSKTDLYIWTREYNLDSAPKKTGLGLEDEQVILIFCFNSYRGGSLRVFHGGAKANLGKVSVLSSTLLMRT